MERFRQSHTNMQGSKLDNYVQPKTTLSPQKTVRLRSFAQSIYNWIISTFGEVWRADCKSGRQKSCSDYRKCFMNLGQLLPAKTHSTVTNELFVEILSLDFCGAIRKDVKLAEFETC